MASRKLLKIKKGRGLRRPLFAITKAGDAWWEFLAKRQAITNHENTIFSVKRLIGRKFTDKEVQRDKKNLPYEIKESADGGVDVKMGDKWLNRQKFRPMILQN